MLVRLGREYEMSKKKKSEAELLAMAAEEFEISAPKAKKLQKEFFEQKNKNLSKQITPPFLEIADQLEAEDDQVFHAAVYNLGLVALAQKKYRKEILNILGEYAENKRKTQEQRAYVQEKIDEIKKAKA